MKSFFILSLSFLVCAGFSIADENKRESVECGLANTDASVSAIVSEVPT